MDHQRVQIVEGAFGIESVPVNVIQFSSRSKVLILTKGIRSFPGGYVQSVNGKTGVVVLVPVDIGAQPHSDELDALTGLASASETFTDRPTTPGTYVPTLTVAGDLSETFVFAAPSGGGGGGSGTVTSVALSGGSTGLSFSGSPITTSGTITLTVGNAATFRSAIGLGGAAVLSVGTTAGTVAAGNDSRLSDSRTPTAHASTHAAAGSDPITISESQVTNLTTDLAAKAPLASPALTGTPTAPTASAGTNTTQVASTAFVRAEVAALVASAPGALDTLDELAAALGDDPNFATTITTALAGKQPLEATLTGIAATAPTADQLIYATGNDTFGVTAFTNYARSFLDDADGAAVLATLGGTAAQGTGAVVRATSPTLVTPALGTPSSGNLANCTFPTLNQSTSGNAATATALQTGRAINGVTFDGTAAITVTAAAGTLTGATLASNVLASSLTSVGTLTGGATGAGFTVALTTSTVTGTLPAANLPALTGAVTSSEGSATTSQTVQADRFVEAPTAKTYTITAKAAYAFTINQIRGLKTGSGSCSLAVQINGTNVTSLSGLSVTTSAQDVTATGANAVAAGDVITFVVSSASSPTDLQFTLSGTR